MLIAAIVRYHILDEHHFVVEHDGEPQCVHEHPGPLYAKDED